MLVHQDKHLYLYHLDLQKVKEGLIKEESVRNLEMCSIIECAIIKKPLQMFINMFLKGYPLEAKTAPKN